MCWRGCNRRLGCIGAVECAISSSANLQVLGVAEIAGRVTRDKLSTRNFTVFGFIKEFSPHDSGIQGGGTEWRDINWLAERWGYKRPNRTP